MKAFVIPLGPVVLHTFVIYVYLNLMFRFVGRRQLGQLTVVDLVVILVLGSAVETAMVNGNTSLAAGFVCAATLFLANRLFTRVFLRSKRFRHLVGAGPVLLVHDGHYVNEHLRRVGLTQEDVLQAVRERECGDIAEIRFAVLETDGSITVVQKGER